METKFALRRKIKNYFKSLTGKNKYQRTADHFNVSYYTVWNVINGKIKNTKTPRADKGQTRSKVEDDGTVSNKNISDFDCIEDFLLHQIMICVRDLSEKKIKVDVRIKLVKDLISMQNNMEKKLLEHFIKRPEAVLILRMMRALSPNISEQEVKKIYAAEYEKLARELS